MSFEDENLLAILGPTILAKLTQLLKNFFHFLQVFWFSTKITCQREL